MRQAARSWIGSLSLLLISHFATANVPSAAIPAPPSLDAEAYVLVDYHSGKILAQKDADRRIDPASLTKMMSIYVIDNEMAKGRLNPNDEVAISPNAWKTEGSRMFVEVGKKIPVKELIRGVIIQSGNDATVALAEYVAGSESAFVELMNQYAKKLHMNGTHFMNSTGIPNAEHYTTAKDLSLLARALITEYPETYKIYSEKWFTYNGIKQPNRNRLLWREDYVDGIKTGHSSTAGYCLAASGQKDNMRLISILLGAKTEPARTEQTLQLLRYGFRFFETHRLFEANTTLNQPRVWMGEQKKVSLGVNQNLYITIPQGQYKSLDAKMNIDKNLTAPIAKGEKHGKITVKLGDNLIAEMPLVALETVNKGGAWDRFSDYVSLGFYKLLKSEEAPKEA